MALFSLYRLLFLNFHNVDGLAEPYLIVRKNKLIQDSIKTSNV